MEAVEAGLNDGTAPADSTLLRVMFDSAALHARLQRPPYLILDSPSRRAYAALRRLADRLPVQVTWIPGHAGIPGNEVADVLAKEALGLPQAGIPVELGPVVAAARKRLEVRWKDEYEAAVPNDHLHRLSTTGLFPDFGRMPRRDSTDLHCLRANRWPPLMDTAHRHKRAAHPVCPVCPLGLTEDTLHFLLICPRWADIRRRLFGDNPTGLWSSLGAHN